MEGPKFPEDHKEHHGPENYRDQSEDEPRPPVAPPLGLVLLPEGHGDAPEDDAPDAAEEKGHEKAKASHDEREGTLVLLRIGVGLRVVPRVGRGILAIGGRGVGAGVRLLVLRWLLILGVRWVLCVLWVLCVRWVLCVLWILLVPRLRCRVGRPAPAAVGPLTVGPA